MNKRTPLYDEHVRLKANMVPFGGWDMPVYYSSVIDEHNATRQCAGLFDTSHMGEIAVTGPESGAFLDQLVAGDVAGLEPGSAVYSPLTNQAGGCVDDLWVYMLADREYCLVVNASTADKDFEWISSHAKDFDVELSNDSDKTGMVALQGPAAIDIMSKICDLVMPSRFNFIQGAVAGCEAMISRTGYTGEDGVEIYVASADTEKLWQALMEAGQPLGMKPVGLGARDTLRLEACYSLYGHELSEQITPVEAGISFAVAKGKTFIGSDVIYRQMEQGPGRRVVAFELTTRGIPREGYDLFVGDDRIGTATSGCFSPSLKKGIGLAMVDAALAKPGTGVEVEIRGKRYPAQIVKKPFVKNV